MGQVIDTNPTDFELWVIYKHSWKTRGGTAGMSATKSVAVSRPIKLQDFPSIKKHLFYWQLVICTVPWNCTINLLFDSNNRVSIKIIFWGVFTIQTILFALHMVVPYASLYILYSKGANIFQKSRNHFQILGTTTVKQLPYWRPAHIRQWRRNQVATMTRHKKFVQQRVNVVT